MVDLNDLPFEVFGKYANRTDDVFKESDKFMKWREKNFVYAREHGKNQGKQNILFGKDRRSIMIEYDDTERQYYPDSHADIYQTQDDGSIRVKALSFSEYSLGRGDSMPYITSINDDTLTGDKALPIFAEIKRAEITAGFRAAKKEFEKKATKSFEVGSIKNILKDTVQGDFTSKLPQEIFGHVSTAPKEQKEHFEAFNEWLHHKEDRSLELYREHNYPVEGMKYGSDDHMFYSEADDLLVAYYSDKESETNYACTYQLYESGPNDALFRTTVSLDYKLPGNYHNQYLVGIKSGLVVDTAEQTRIAREKELATEYRVFKRNKDLTEKQFEEETAGVMYTTSTFKPAVS